jgi:hypothetical protein
LENARWVYGIIAKDLLECLAGPNRVTILLPLADSKPSVELNRQGVPLKIKEVGVVMSPARGVDLSREGGHVQLRETFLSV